VEKELGTAYLTIQKKIKDVSNKVYDKDIERYKNFKYLESKQSIYLVFRAVASSDRRPGTLYVGKTSQTIKDRFNNHFSQIKAMVNGEKEWVSKYLWMAQVINSGGNLVIMELNRVQTSDVYKYEQEWIDFLRSVDFKLLNKINTRFYNNKILKL
jgi:hypothetical protein